MEFFFVLSGSLMAEILIDKRQPIGLFLKRRIARVVPALAFCVLVAGTVINAIVLYQGSSLDLLSPVAALLFFHNYLPLSRSYLNARWAGDGDNRQPGAPRSAHPPAGARSLRAEALSN